MSESEGQNKTADGAPRATPPAGQSPGQSQGAMLVLDAGARRPLQGEPVVTLGGGEAEDGAGGAEHGIDEARILARVRGLYRELLEEPVPQEFMRLIRALEEKERSK